MATNEQILESIANFRKELKDEVTEVKEIACRNDEAIRGNGKLGLKAQVAENTKRLEKIDRYFMTVVGLVLAEFLARVFGLI